jgi:hypothetical protein
MKTPITNTTSYKYTAREIIDMIAKDLNVPTRALTFTINSDGSYNVTCNNQYITSTSDLDPYEQYRDANGRLPSSMW